MNILFLSELFYPHGSGGELATYLYAKLLAESKFRVIVITHRFLGESQRSDIGGLIVYRLPLLRSIRSIKYSILERFDVLFSNFMRKLIRWADVVYIPKFWYSAIPLAKNCGKPVITHFHAYFPLCPLASLYDPSKNAICNIGKPYICSAKCIATLEKNRGRSPVDTLKSMVLNSTIGHCFLKLAKMSDALIFVSRAQRNLMTSRATFMSQKSYVIHNPVPRLLNINFEGNDFGYFGGPSPLKGFDVLCRALSLVDRRKISVHVTKLHSLPKSTTSSLEKLGIIPYGRLDEKSYESIYNTLRAVIVPSIWPEPWGYVVTEAILRGRLVVTSPVGGILEQIEGCKGVFLFPAGNHEQLARIIEFVETLDKRTVIDLGIQNRQLFLKKFQNERILQDFMRVLSRVADKS